MRSGTTRLRVAVQIRHCPLPDFPDHTPTLYEPRAMNASRMTLLANPAGPDTRTVAIVNTCQVGNENGVLVCKRLNARRTSVSHHSRRRAAAGSKGGR